MKSYLKHNRYLLLSTILILLVQLASTLVYGDSRIAMLILASSAIYKISVWLFLIGLVAYNFIIGLIYWKTEQHKPINFQLKYLHINLTLVTTFLILLLVSFNLLDKQSLLVKVYSSFPFLSSDSTKVSLLAVIFIVAQILFTLYLIRTTLFFQIKKEEVIDNISNQ